MSILIPILVVLFGIVLVPTNAAFGFGSYCDKQESCETCVDGQTSDGFTVECRWCPKSHKCYDKYDYFVDQCASGTHALYPHDCPSKCVTKYEYNETIARKMFLMCAAVYTNNPQQCLNNGLKHQQFVNTSVITFDCGFGGDCTALVSVSHSDKAIGLAFRGTTTPDQMVDMCTRNIWHQVPVPWGGTAMSYWYDGWKGLSGCFQDQMIELAMKYPDYDLWITGHSLGGAMASIAAGHLAYTLKHDKGIEPSDRLKLVTFGEPRTGDIDFAEGLREYVPYDFRVVRHRDIVAHLPPCIPDVTGLTSTQCKAESGKAYPYHHGTEVWYANEMKPGDTHQTCKGPPCHEDGLCSHSLYHKFSVLQHLEYFNKNTIAFYMMSCRGGLTGSYTGMQGHKVAPEDIPNLHYSSEKCQSYPYPASSSNPIED